MNSFKIADINKAIKYLEDKYKTININLEIDDNNRLNFHTTDMNANSVKIVVYRSNDEDATKFPELIESRRLT